MPLRLNGTTITEVIFKNADNPSGINLTHLRMNDTTVWHKNYVPVVTSPTCIKQGYTTYTCSDCGHSYTENYTPAIGHEYTALRVPATCTDQGYILHSCVNEGCGFAYKDNYTDALGHTWVNADCDTPKTCSVCGTTEGSALGHTYGAGVITKPTCTTKGHTTYTCSVCGYFYTTDITPATGHTSSDWIIDTAATTTATGSKHKECTVCGTVLETATIPVIVLTRPNLSVAVDNCDSYDEVAATIINYNSIDVECHIYFDYTASKSVSDYSRNLIIPANSSKVVYSTPTAQDESDSTFDTCTITVYWVEDTSLTRSMTVYGSESNEETTTTG